MNLSETIKLYPTKEQKRLIEHTMAEYINTVNCLVSTELSGYSISKFSTKDISAELPSALKNQCLRDAKSVISKYRKYCHKAVLKYRWNETHNIHDKVSAPKVSVLKKPCCYINNQNYRIKGDNIEFPVTINGKSTRISVNTKITDTQKNKLSNSKLGTMRIVIKNSAIVAQVAYKAAEAQVKTDGNTMGVDLGVKCPAVLYCSNGKVRFLGNGRKNKYIRRHFDTLKHNAQINKHPEALNRFNDKEQRIMKDIDHKISREIINTAIANNVSVIRLEQLSNIRSATSKSRKNNHSIHNWSFYRLASFIEYKARLASIRIEYVNPAFTSQKCPKCGSVHHADDRNYTCKCGYHTHRDLLGAINICNSTEYVGDSIIRHTA